MPTTTPAHRAQVATERARLQIATSGQTRPNMISAHTSMTATKMPSVVAKYITSPAATATNSRDQGDARATTTTASATQASQGRFAR